MYGLSRILYSRVYIYIFGFLHTPRELWKWGGWRRKRGGSSNPQKRWVYTLCGLKLSRFEYIYAKKKREEESKKKKVKNIWYVYIQRETTIEEIS